MGWWEYTWIIPSYSSSYLDDTKYGLLQKNKVFKAPSLNTPDLSSHKVSAREESTCQRNHTHTHTVGDLQDAGRHAPIGNDHASLCGNDKKGARHLTACLKSKDVVKPGEADPGGCMCTFLHFPIGRSKSKEEIIEALLFSYLFFREINLFTVSLRYPALKIWGYPHWRSAVLKEGGGKKSHVCKPVMSLSTKGLNLGFYAMFYFLLFTVSHLSKGGHLGLSRLNPSWWFSISGCTFDTRRA